MENNKGRLILILGLLTAIGPLSIDMYLPAFPDIAANLNTTLARVMLTLSAYFVGISVGQIIYGPLLERFGRKFPLYIGIIIYIIASAGCALASSVDALIAFRVLQALGGCAGMVTSRAIVRDLFEVKDSARIFSTLMLVVAVSPIIAPTLGGYLTAWFGWRTIFWVLIAINTFILAGVFFWLPESRPPNPNFSLKPAAITSSFITILRHPQFYTYALTGAVAAAGLYAYISGSPAVFMDVFGLNEKQYGWVFAIIALGIISASQVNNLLLRKYSSEQIIKVALASQCLVGLIFVGSLYAGISNLYLTIALIFLYLSCQGFIFPNTSALSLAPFGNNAGNASALMGGLQMGFGALASALVSFFQNLTAYPMSMAMASCSLIAFTILSFGRNVIVKRASLVEIEEEEVDMIGGM